MTENEFKELPLLLTRADLMAIGFTRKDIEYLVLGKRLNKVKSSRDNHKGKYLKVEVAKLIGFKV